ncbi:MAG: MerR family transcriptional regulator, light-induced transcriptional regulator [Acidobacteriota bacterium]|jgi:excisionase family DNA binding protein|nr:MerR family transcriptional regulator, light-induced transcriptional regulator [Acidobacteriota bacterium]
MNDRLWTSAEVASAFRVGVSSIKRWTDEGELEAARTPGKHRRYALEAIHRFARIRGLSITRLPPIDDASFESEPPLPADITLYEALRNGDAHAVRQLATPRVDSLAKQAAFYDRVIGDALREIGDRWERGDLGVDEEHRASYLIADAIDDLRPRATRAGSLALLACPPDEHHELPLRLVRVVLESSGWRTDYRGANLPWTSLSSAIDAAKPHLVAFTARSAMAFETSEFERIVDLCRSRGTTVITGGDWARGGVSASRHYLRFRTLRGFERWLRDTRHSEQGMPSSRDRLSRGHVR